MNNYEEENILERLKHPEREEQRRRMGRGLFIRNILNSIFILVALAAMVGIVALPSHSPRLPFFYVLGLIAVLIKMVEVLMRMPGIKRLK